MMHWQICSELNFTWVFVLSGKLKEEKPQLHKDFRFHRVPTEELQFWQGFSSNWQRVPEETFPSPFLYKDAV